MESNQEINNTNNHTICTIKVKQNIKQIIEKKSQSKQDTINDNFDEFIKINNNYDFEQDYEKRSDTSSDDNDMDYEKYFNDEESDEEFDDKSDEAIDDYNKKIIEPIITTNIATNECKQYKQLPNKFVGAFIDGDGTISINKTTSKNGFQVQISLPQCVSNILEIMQLQYGGRFYKTTKPIGGKQRDIYSLRINGRDCVLILKDLINDGCIIKFEQAKCAQRYIDIMDLTGDEINKEKHKLYERIHSLNQRKIKSEIKPYHIIDIV
jgi:hypothetical protein